MSESSGNYRYVFHNTVTRSFLGEFMMKNVSFNSPLSGPGGQLKGTISIDEDAHDVELVKPATELDLAAVYVIYRDPDDGIESFLWGGPVIAREWQPQSRQVVIEAVEWKSWFYTREYGPSITPPYANRKLSYTTTDQLTIARALVLDATSQPGTPEVTVPVVTSTRTRDLNVNGYDHKYVGDLIDSMANRTDGFDWDVEIRKSVSDKMPELVVNFYYPEKSANSGIEFSSTRTEFDRGIDGKGTILALPSWPENVANRRTRIWATGSSSPPDQPVAMDDDPLLETDEILLREATYNFSTVSSPATLSEHAQAYREVLGVLTESIDIPLKPNQIKPTAFRSGDRVSLRIKDEWLDIDEPSVRVVDRSVTPASGSSGERIVATLDLSDATVADPDEGDTV